jgi:hypothetical protein
VFFIIGQIKNLLYHGTTPMLVIWPKALVRIDSQFVVCQSENKPGNKIRFVEVEHAPIENDVVLAISQVVPTYGRVSIQTIYFFMGRTGEQTDLYGIVLLKILSSKIFIGHHFCDGQNPYHQK